MEDNLEIGPVDELAYYIEIYRYFLNWDHGWNFKNFNLNYINFKTEIDATIDKSSLNAHLSENIPRNVVQESIIDWLRGLRIPDAKQFAERLKSYPVKMILLINAHGEFTDDRF